MSTSELIKEIKNLPLDKRLFVLEEAIKSIRKEESRDQISLASEALVEDYKTDEDLTSFSALDLENFYEISQTMLQVKPSYITDAKGKRVSVVLPIDEFNNLMEELEELEDIRLFDEAKKSKKASIPLDEAFEMIEKKRNSK
jgi:poly(A) polymerase Pap1